MRANADPLPFPSADLGERGARRLTASTTRRRPGTRSAPTLPRRGLSMLIVWLVLSLLGAQHAGWVHEVSHGGQTARAGSSTGTVAVSTGIAAESNVAAVSTGIAATAVSHPSDPAGGKSAGHFCQLYHAGTLAAFITPAPVSMPALATPRLTAFAPVAAQPGQPQRLVYRSQAPPLST